VSFGNGNGKTALLFTQPRILLHQDKAKIKQAHCVAVNYSE
jgi:hypothetical protein